MKKAIDVAVRIKVARTLQDFADVGTFFREYAQWLRIDENFPNLEAEIANLPGQYASPSDEVFLADKHTAHSRPWVNIHVYLRIRAACCQLTR